MMRHMYFSESCGCHHRGLVLLYFNGKTIQMNGNKQITAGSTVKCSINFFSLSISFCSLSTRTCLFFFFVQFRNVTHLKSPFKSNRLNHNEFLWLDYCMAMAATTIRERLDSFFSLPSEPFVLYRIQLAHWAIPIKYNFYANDEQWIDARSHFYSPPSVLNPRHLSSAR